MSKTVPLSVAIIGSGPAGLMAADVLTRAEIPVTVIEKRPGPGRKLFIAGSSGLNITNVMPLEEFIRQYSGSQELWRKWLSEFSPQDWLTFLENLGLKTFLGTSRRYFVRDMKALKLIRAWKARLSQRGVQWLFQEECTGFALMSKHVLLKLSTGGTRKFAAACFALGGGSYEPDEKPLRWPAIFREHGIAVAPFVPTNVGYRVPWPQRFIEEADGLPLKNIRFTSSRGTCAGDLTVTKYGLEGTPVYTFGTTGEATLDLKPDMTLEKMRKVCLRAQENLSPLRRIKKHLGLCPAANALLFHTTGKATQSDLESLLHTVKNLSLRLEGPQALDEAISSDGGVSFSEINDDLMLKKCPGVFVAGEMLDWAAPTGGFLIQGCVSSGHAAALGIIRHLRQSFGNDFASKLTQTEV